MDRGTFDAGATVDFPVRVDGAARLVYVVDGTSTLGELAIGVGDTVSLVGGHDPLVAVTDVDLVVITQPVAAVRT